MSIYLAYGNYFHPKVPTVPYKQNRGINILTNTELKKSISLKFVHLSFT